MRLESILSKPSTRQTVIKVNSHTTRVSLHLIPYVEVLFCMEVFLLESPDKGSRAFFVFLSGDFLSTYNPITFYQGGEFI